MTMVPPEELTFFGKVMRGIWTGLTTIAFMVVAIPVAIAQDIWQVWRRLTLRRP